MAISDYWFKTIEEARDSLVKSITKSVTENGKWSGSTCPTGAGYGWDPLMHEALVWLQTHPPPGIKITSRYSHECYDWLAIPDLNTIKSRTDSNRLALINDLAMYCYKHTESWQDIGEGLAGLFWAISADDGKPFDASIAEDKYATLIELIKSHPDRLWEQLKMMGAVI